MDDWQKDFAVFILSHGRPTRVVTYNTIRKLGYTGKIYIIVDNEDKKLEKYIELYGSQVIIFDKAARAKSTDYGDSNHADLKTVLFARNETWDIARQLGLNYFLTLDDDYRRLSFAIDGSYNYIDKKITDLDSVIRYTLAYYKTIPAATIAFAQTGDYIGGADNNFHKSLLGRRKAMNSFFCSVDRQFEYVGRMNDDVNTYVYWGGKGLLFMTFPFIKVLQTTTQQQSGGLTDMYLNYGTYVKSFFTIMYAPACTKISTLGTTYRRIHHKITWNNAVPYIIPEEFRKD